MARKEHSRAEAERAQIKALHFAKAKARTDLRKRELKDMTFYRMRYSREETGLMRDSFRRQRDAIRAAGGIEDLGRIRRMYAEERAPMLEEAAMRPERPSVGKATLRQLAEQEARTKAARADRNRQRRRQSKRRKSPLEIGTVGVTGAEENDRGRIIVVRRGA